MRALSNEAKAIEFIIRMLVITMFLITAINLAQSQTTQPIVGTYEAMPYDTIITCMISGHNSVVIKKGWTRQRIYIDGLSNVGDAREQFGTILGMAWDASARYKDYLFETGQKHSPEIRVYYDNATRVRRQLLKVISERDIYSMWPWFNKYGKAETAASR